MVEAGKFYKFKVTRKTDLGFMLNDGEVEILMHYRQAAREYEPEEVISAFIYFDNKGRLCAQTKDVLATSFKPGFCEVVEVRDEGLFVDIHTSKDVLVSSDSLPYNHESWPQVGEMLPIILKPKKNSLVARPVNKEICLKAKSGDVIENMSYEATICLTNKGGYGLVTKDFVFIFVPYIMARGKHRIGELCNVKITKITDTDVYGSMIDVKEKQMAGDADIILEYLNKHDGKMPFTAKSSAEEIEKAFRMSRKAFKRAYGELYRERKIDFEGNETILVIKESNYKKQ